MQSFEPNTAATGTNEKLWQGEVGLLPYTTHVVFTKASLISFLKTVHVEVDSNGSELKKLPKFATFGKLHDSGEASTAPAAPTEEAGPAVNDAPVSSGNEMMDVLSGTPGFRPTRKVRELPGGGSAQIKSLFGDYEEEEPIAKLSLKPSPRAPEPQEPFTDYTAPKPSRKVRQLPGGGSSNIHGLFA